ncbi:hypothetical protein PIB30_006474 [Stylosanthes scabra]|uniref:Ubiquitin-like protease family profile domain-containing protein n=1 Tax=Stylosanthes scabra TaxID=79078 RepID=A0ABU6V3A3_9FABA|nr:hypothetical protein [Stylosanthes scabra]
MQLINYTRMIQSIASTKHGKPRVWFLPSNFGKEIMYGVVVDKIRNDYESRWKKETDSQEHIFVPILDVPDVWYLMLLYVKESKVYCLDVCGGDEDRERKVADMDKKVSTSLARMRATLFLVQCEHNEMGGYVDRNAEDLWNKISHQN